MRSAQLSRSRNEHRNLFVALAIAVCVPGCYGELRTSAGTMLKTGDSAAARREAGGAEASFSGALGLAYARPTNLHAGFAMFEISSQTGLTSWGGGLRGEWAVAQDWLRSYGRATVSHAACTTRETGEPGECRRRPARDLTMVSIGFGIALTSTDKADRAVIYRHRGVALGIVLAHASDPALGDSQFLGLELSITASGNLIGHVADILTANY